MVAFRLRSETITLLGSLAKRTHKTRTRILEEALTLHASTAK